MKIVFMGTPAAAVPCLARMLLDGHSVEGVYTQPDRPSGRGNRVAFSPVKEFSVSNGIDVYQPLKIRTEDAADQFRALKADLAVVVAYGRILPHAFLNAFSRGAINVHFSLLPKYRGAAPVNWAIVNGEMETGVTTMKMDAGLDTGDMLLQQTVNIEAEENAVKLMAKLSTVGAELLSETLGNLDNLKGIAQDHDAATFAPILKKEDGQINWSMNAREIANRIRGFQPFPGSFSTLHGKKLTIWEASPENLSDETLAAAGTVLTAKGEQLRVECGDGSALAISELQIEGKRRMSSRDFINGTHLKIGDLLS